MRDYLLRSSDRLEYRIDRLSSDLAAVADWRGWVRKIPYVNFRDGWEVKMVPPFGGCLARFVIRHPDRPEREVSVYLDGYGTMDTWKAPHWEVYPAEEGEPSRCAMDETDELVRLIERGLECE